LKGLAVFAGHELGNRERIAVPVGKLAADAHDALGIGIGQWTQQDALNDGKNDCIRANAQGERRYGDGRESGILKEDANRMPRVQQEIPHAMDTGFLNRRFQVDFLSVRKNSDPAS
jgi:hypothetical protein